MRVPGKGRAPGERFAAVISHTGPSAESACDLIAGRTGLPKVRVKEAMAKGAVWIRRSKGASVRLRRATAVVNPGDRIEVFYDPEILRRDSPPAQCVADEGRYTVWYKPPGLLVGGTRFGDHCSLLRQAERRLDPPRPVFPVHRLDRESSGLVVLAHDREAAARLSGLFRERRVDKEYRVEVRGAPGPPGCTGVIDSPLDGRHALTEYETISHDRQNDISLLRVRTKTGRLHQIRRHLDAIGHPVVGDPVYGRGNKDPGGLRLEAVSVSFLCPFSATRCVYSIRRDHGG